MRASPTQNISFNRGAWIAEHDGIFNTLMRLSRGVARLTPIGVNARRLRKLGEEVRDLRVRMEQHYAGEERDGGLYGRLVEILPEQASTLARLRLEHTDLLTRVGHIEELLSSGEADDVGRLLTDISALTDAMQQHEAVEERLSERSTQVQSRPRD